MHDVAPTWVSRTRRFASEIALRSFVPYSKMATGAIVLLSDGVLIPGVRVESASFSLSIPAVLNAVTTAVAYERTDIIGIVQSCRFDAGDRAYIEKLAFCNLDSQGDDFFVSEAAALALVAGAFLDPFVRVDPFADGSAWIALTRAVATAAYTPASLFPVGCLLETDQGWIRGVNVEHEDWSRILCAERNAVGTAMSYGIKSFLSLYLSCPKDNQGSPCGACRQVLAEQAPGMNIGMDRGNECDPEYATPELLLPGFFSGDGLRADPV